MSKSMSSPTARLLQSSRLFSLPRPLPTPELAAATSVGEYRASPSATTPYPTRQAITTPASSLYRGDWGLKRPLPAKTTQRTSTPHIRVLAQDNTEHITSFHSAADHTQTSAKFREIGLAIGATDSKDLFESAYDDHVDVTRIDPKKPETHETRWKRNGPELEHMYKGDFELYVQSKVLPRKQEFREFLQNWLLRQRLRNEEAKARERGDSDPITPEREEEVRQSIVRNFAEEILRLRKDYVSNKRGSELAVATIEFLDLKMSIPKSQAEGFSAIQAKDYLSNEVSTMPTTHPAAGLSYLRTNLFMANHPLYGPQANREPVLARVLLPRERTGAARAQGKYVGGTFIGVGGLVVNDPITTSFDKPTAEPGVRAHMQPTLMAAKILPTLAGGNKYFTTPTTATITPAGRIDLGVRAAPPDSMLVKLGLGEEVKRAKAPQQSVALSSPPPPAPRQTTRMRIRDDHPDDSPIMRRATQLFNERRGGGGGGGGGGGPGAARFGYGEY